MAHASTADAHDRRVLDPCAALLIAINMVVAVLLVQTGQIFPLSPECGWAIELQALVLVVAAAIEPLDAGCYSAGGAAGRWN